MENTAPHSAKARSDLAAARIDAGKSPKLPTPSPHGVAMLRRIARGWLQVTMIEGKATHTYDDGTPVHGESGKPLTTHMIHRFVSNGWLVPVKGEGLIENAPQRYVVPKLK